MYLQCKDIRPKCNKILIYFLAMNLGHSGEGDGRGFMARRHAAAGHMPIPGLFFEGGILHGGWRANCCFSLRPTFAYRLCLTLYNIINNIIIIYTWHSWYMMIYTKIFISTWYHVTCIFETEHFQGSDNRFRFPQHLEPATRTFHTSTKLSGGYSAQTFVSSMGFSRATGGRNCSTVAARSKSCTSLTPGTDLQL